MSCHLITLATFLLPPSRRAWGQAMKAEYDALPAGQSTFAWGCFGASLRENVTTGEGWARLGFGVVLILAGLLVLSSVLGIIHQFERPFNRPVAQIIMLSAIVGFTFLPLLLGRAALEAMDSPLDRFRLAKIGLKTAPAMILIFGSLSLWWLFGHAIALSSGFLPAWFPYPTMILINCAVCSVAMFCIGHFSKFGAGAMMYSGLTGATITTLSCAITYSVDMQKFGFYLGATGQYIVVMLLFALSGAILMWMERPAKAVK
jgi:hypothetical protein